MLDSTLGMLAHCILNKGRVTTTEFFISYIKPITEGDELFVRAVIKNAGKQLIRVYGEGYRKSDGKIVCTANGAFMVLKNNK